VAVATSNPFRIEIVPAVQPWFSAQADNAWSLQGTGTMKAVSACAGRPDSLSYALTDTWTGSAPDNDAREAVFALQGGHDNAGAGSNNGVLVFRFDLAVPTWMARRVGEINSGVAGGMNGPGVYASGQPSGSHTYNRSLVADGVFWMPGIDSQDDQNGNHTSSTFSFLLSQTAGVFRSHGRWTLGDVVNKLLGGCSAYDPVTQRVFTLFQYGSEAAYFHAPTVLAAADVQFPGTVPGVTAFAMPSSPAYSVAFCDPEYRLLIYVSENNIQTLNLDNIGAGWTQRAGAPPVTPYGGGFCYHQSAHRIYCYPWGGGGNLIRVMNVPASGSWPSWRNVTLGGINPPQTNGTFNQNQGSGPFNRFNLIEDMGNGQACLYYYPRFNVTGMYVAKVATGGL
jgi:hypothetical protein